MTNALIPGEDQQSAAGTKAPFRPVFVLLADGTSALIRPVRAEDHSEVVALHEHASDESIYLRFFSHNRASSEAFVKGITHPGPGARSLVAVRSGRLVGVATATTVDGGDDGQVAGRCAEVAFFVDETLHGVGIATALLEQLAGWARQLRMTTFVAEVLAENVPMLRVFHDAGFGLSEQREHGVVTLTLDLRANAETVTAGDARERQAERRSLEPLLVPGSVAVLGVSRETDKVGRNVLDNIRRAGFGGQLYALGRPGLAIPGVSCVSELGALPEGLDLVVVALPGPQVEEAVRVCAQRGAHSCVVLTSGLGETGQTGRDAEQRMAQVAHEHGMRLVGPNCFGVLSNLRGTRLEAIFGRTRPRPGALAIGSQSGGVGLSLLEAAEARGTGVACFLSLGNKADVSGNDLLAAWTDDPEIKAVVLYLESFHRPRKFARLAATLSRRKPLLVVFGGSSAAGTRGGASHTAAAATPARAIQALFRAAGAVDVDGVPDLVDTAALLTEQPLPRGPRLGIIGNAGGMGIIAADAAHRLALDVPELGDGTRRSLVAAIPRVAGVSNPVDLGAGAGPEEYAAAVRLLMASGEVDSVLVSVAATSVTDLDGIETAVEQAAQDAPELPCLAVISGAPLERGDRTTRFASSEAAVRAMAHAVRYVTWLRTADTPVPVPRVADEDVFVQEPPTAAGEQSVTWLGAEASAELLAGAGVRSAPWRQVRSGREAVAAAHDLGFPLVVKAADPTIVHKTEGRLVHTGLRTRRDLLAAVRQVHEAAGPRSPVLVQQQLSGPEFAVGVVRDPRFGPLVMVASGGVQLDLWGDQTYLMPPVGPADVRTALQSLRTWPLLTGFRGSPPLDGDAVVELVRSVAELALDRPDVLELDLNPVIVTQTGPFCVDAKVRVRSAEER
ncbi:MAG TPA: GNAT family N-acetyltransferase [Nocardioidaceae bacterium]|nr:GNAT family N-acetyltransferase [Nocardioidaceae bacterium]